MLPRFSNEVLSGGPEAVLPQHLTTAWLAILQKRADDFLDNNFTMDQCAPQAEPDDPLLIACVHEMLPADINTLSPDDLAERVTIYALCLTMESIRRASDIEMPLPSTADLLSLDRIVAFGRINPEFRRFLEGVCILPADTAATEESWLQRLKRKILDRIQAE